MAATGVVAGRSRVALECYVTQLGSLRSSLRTKRYAALQYKAGTQAEVFWELSAGAYRAVHRAGPGGEGQGRGWISR